MISVSKNLLMLGLSAAILSLSAALSAQTAEEYCTEEVMMSYYPSPFVAKTLEKFEVPQEQRQAIIQGLEEKDKEVIPTIEDRASKMNPNPLKDPARRQEAVKLFRDTLLEMFATVMQAHGINDKEKIQSMLDDVQKQKAKQFAACMEQQERRGPPPGGYSEDPGAEGYEDQHNRRPGY